MTTSFNQFRDVSYLWMEHSMYRSPLASRAEDAMFCSRCNVQIPGAVTFCIRCGSMIKRKDTNHPRAAAQQPPVARTGTRPATMPRPAAAWRAKKALAIGACLATLAGAAACGSYVSSMQSETHTVDIVSEERGIIDSYADQLPTSFDTVAGKLTRVTQEDGARYVALNGKALYRGGDAQWQFPIRTFDLPDAKQAILMASSGGHGYSCETKFFFLVADKDGVQPTPLFGTCAPRITFKHAGDTITLLLPKIGGLSTVEFKTGTVIEDGAALAMHGSNDPFDPNLNRDSLLNP